MIMINFPYSNKGGRLLKFIAQGINDEISSSLRQAIKVFINESFVEFHPKGSFQIKGIVNLQKYLLTN